LRIDLSQSRDVSEGDFTLWQHGASMQRRTLYACNPAEATMSCKPEQYLRFAGPRLRPALDLLARDPLAEPQQVCVLGCGTGNVTEWLARRGPQAALTGVDRSAAMLVRARQSPPGVDWQQADIGRWQPDAPFDLIFSNAAQHWLPGHARLLPSPMRARSTIVARRA
jgi:trans-aconitate 2-methyltransferase